ncbi:MAG TPA: EAL domain-containing protein [Solirubrobacteraceae bacterium]|nr:EAL domain-containing protein [Solirubrobacteraceae bacterium]
MKGLFDPADPGPVGLDRVVALAQRHLGLDVVFVAELTGAGQVYRAAAGDVASFNIVVDGPACDAAFSRRLVAGEVPSFIGDTATECVGGLPGACEAHVGSVIGVPLRLSGGTPYGVLCGFSHAADSTLDERDVGFMSMLGELIAYDLDGRRSEELIREDILRLIENESVQVTQNIEIAYQPIIDLLRGHCLGIEALARFPEPFAGPDVTLAAARTVGLALELERLLIVQAWKMIALLGPGQFLALNVSPEALVELARRANLREDLPLSQLVVEVTEHQVVESYAALHSELAPLRERGLRIAVDDAGAGYASLRHVLELRPDFIKVDRWLIDGIADDHARRVAVGAFLSLALDLGSSVVAEGVERPADLAAVRSLGLHAAQGYLLGRPTTSQAALSQWIGPSPAAQGHAPLAARNGLARTRKTAARPNTAARPATPRKRPATPS